MGSGELETTSSQSPWRPRVLWASPHERVVYKPAGVVSELTSDPLNRSILSQIRAEFPGARLPHRLDQVSSGILVAALTPESIKHHNLSIEDQSWKRLYIARVRKPDSPDELIGDHKSYLKRRRHRRGPDRMEVVQSGGQPSRLRVLAVEDAPLYPGQSHALIELQAGRFHQIRVMLSTRGFPLVGDQLYGGTGGVVFLEHIRLRFRPFGAKAERSVFDENAPERESVSPALLECIAAWEDN